MCNYSKFINNLTAFLPPGGKETREMEKMGSNREIKADRQTQIEDLGEMEDKRKKRGLIVYYHFSPWVGWMRGMSKVK